MRNGLGTLRRSEAVLFVIPSEVEGSALGSLHPRPQSPCGSGGEIAPPTRSTLAVPVRSASSAFASLRTREKRPAREPFSVHSGVPSVFSTSSSSPSECSAKRNGPGTPKRPRAVSH